MNKSKRTRTSFTVDQLEGLEQYFRESQYVTSADRKMIADRLGLSETQVGISKYFYSFKLLSGFYRNQKSSAE